MSSEDPLIVALDLSDWERIKKVAESLVGEIGIIKVGMEAFCSQGPRIIDYLRNLGYRVFLDLKLHDIPVTVAKTVSTLIPRGIHMLTLHCLGGEEMLRRAREAVDEATSPEETRPLLLGVTVLTSLDEGSWIAMGWAGKVREKVLNLAQMALGAGLEGLVVSADELGDLRSRFGREPVLVVPGIRMESWAGDDQRRVATPGDALSRGANFIVVGRPIVQSEDPALMVRKIKREMGLAQIE